MCAPIVDRVAKKYNAFIGIVALGLNKGPRADFTQFSKTSVTDLRFGYCCPLDVKNLFTHLSPFARQRAHHFGTRY